MSRRLPAIPWPTLPRRAAGKFRFCPNVEREALVVGSRPERANFAPVNEIEISQLLVLHIRVDHDTSLTIGRTAKAVDLPLQAWINLEEGVTKRLTFNKAVRQLIEWAIKVVVHHHVNLVDT